VIASLGRISCDDPGEVGSAGSAVEYVGGLGADFVSNNAGIIK
jgi:hypothetical protein